jgi:hypothetical protein
MVDPGGSVYMMGLHIMGFLDDQLAIVGAIFTPHVVCKYRKWIGLDQS